jgi:lysophospholipase L1-like esterase
MPVPPVLVVAPPPLGSPCGASAEKFAGGELKCAGLAAAYREMADGLGCPFFDAGSVVAASPIDGVHLDADQHQCLGEALAPVVEPLLD